MAHIQIIQTVLIFFEEIIRGSWGAAGAAGPTIKQMI